MSLLQRLEKPGAWSRGNAEYHVHMEGACDFTGGKLSADIDRILDLFAHRDVTLGEIVQIMHQRAYCFLLFLVALPFCTPVPLPGLSTPFGVVIAFVGLRIACGLSPWLPKRLMRVRLPAKWLPRMLRAAERPIRWLERMLKPSWLSLTEPGIFRRIHGVMICISGLLLLLPLPVPFSNFFPAVSVVFLACALLESDGRFSIAGAIFFCAAIGYFALICFGGAALASAINDWWQSHFG